MTVNSLISPSPTYLRHFQKNDKVAERDDVLVEQLKKPETRSPQYGGNQRMSPY